MEGAPHETFLVLDATTGQNALTQAVLFKEAVDLTGIVLTKLDGTAKGGIVLGICDELKVPVRYIGLGERAEDLREFKVDEFVEALFGREGDEAAAA
jgi:fused signal recognition particle receptor